MSWFPNFLNPWPAAIGAAIVVPLLLVLYFLKLRRQEMAVSSTLLWRKSIQDLQVNAPFQKLRRNLLLLLQLLLLLLLLLSLSRPVVNWTPGPGKLTVILIDHSASMSARDANGRSRLDEAKRQARELVASMGRDASAMVIAFTDSAETVAPFTHDATTLRQAIDDIQPTDRKSRLKLAYQLAEARITNFNPDQIRSLEQLDVRLYSDGRMLDSDDASIHTNVVMEKLGSEKTGNIAIVALNAKRNYERPTQVQVFARLANFGPEPVAAFVQLSVNGLKVDAAGADASDKANVGAVSGGRLHEVFLLPERWDERAREAYEKGGGRSASDSVEFELDLEESAVIKIEQMHKDGDGLPADDVAQVVVPPPKSLAVLLVTEGNYFLERAISSLPLQKHETITVGEYQQKMPVGYDVILFDRFKPEKLPEAGNFVYIGEVPDGLKLKVASATPTTGPSEPGAEPIPLDPSGRQPIILDDVGVLDWKRDHPILRGLSMSKLYVAHSLKLEVPLESEVLIDGLKGPLVVLHREGKSTHLVIAFDVLQSNWPLRVSFPIFLNNALQYLAIGSDMDVRQSFEPGATPRIQRASLLRGGTPVREVTLKGPNGSTKLKVPDAGEFALPPLDHVGLYSTDPPVPQFEQMAVNLLDSNESNLLPAEKAPGGVSKVEEATGGGKSRLELWWWLVVAGALPLLMIEWWVYTRRVHL